MGHLKSLETFMCLRKKKKKNTFSTERLISTAGCLTATMLKILQAATVEHLPCFSFQLIAKGGKRQRSGALVHLCHLSSLNEKRLSPGSCLVCSPETRLGPVCRACLGPASKNQPPTHPPTSWSPWQPEPATAA